MKAVANQPVSVAIEASGMAFQFYSEVRSNDTFHINKLDVCMTIKYFTFFFLGKKPFVFNCLPPELGLRSKVLTLLKKIRKL